MLVWGHLGGFSRVLVEQQQKAEALFALTAGWSGVLEKQSLMTSRDCMNTANQPHMHMLDHTVYGFKHKQSHFTLDSVIHKEAVQGC